MIGARLGPYEITDHIGAGGMGEVWRARDPRLGRDVAIKVLPAEFAADPDRLRRFEQEARAAAALNHPNILVLFDAGQHEGQPYLVTEMLEGDSLRELIAKGGLTVSRSVELGIQIAKGLAAAHEKRIVHRDLKPGNVFVTRDGTVKILDFGLAKLTQPTSDAEGAVADGRSGTDTASGLAVGTVGYMAPEQIRLQAVDQRADIFAFGCVLYEMLSGRRAFHGETPGDTMSAILSKDPEPLSGAIERLPAALDQIVRRCLEKRPADRFGSARDLGFALQAVVDSVPREVVRRPEEIRPYPGLAAFTEADAVYFFGREEEIASLWRKIPDRKLLALIGPSGAGKTSFLRAGVIPQAPPGWRCVIATPGRGPFAALARALVPEFAGDLEATGRLFQLDEPDVAVEVFGQWQSRCDHGLVVVDQFEELFTLNGEDVQARFADLLGRIAVLDGIHVLLSMRDDFFFQCSGHEALASVFSAVTPLRPLTSEAMTDALVKPARKYGFDFEDEALVGEMVGAVVGERGALPLLAFTVARLWDERDRESKLLTREAYERLGGVGGALAQHAEATLELIGGGRQAIVRELFRNLVTAEQTRCLVDVDELLSVFATEQRSDARSVLERLVEARLLTSFEEEGTDGRHRQRVEVVHESLLTAWPRLVRWRAQDAEGALLRDQLRQAAHLWEEKGRPDDLLWTGASYQEYQLWRARYPGGLSELEASFGHAMTGLAGRRRRRRRLLYGVVLAGVTGAAVAIAFSRRQAVVEAHRAEAAQVLALGRLRLADHPNAAVAYSIASLGLAENEPARRFAVEALWQGPPAVYLSDPVVPLAARWSPDGKWLAYGGTRGLAVIERETGLRRELTNNFERPFGFSADGALLLSRPEGSTGARPLHVWAMADGRLIRRLDIGQGVLPRLVGDRLLTATFDRSAPPGERPAVVRSMAIGGEAEETIGRWQPYRLADWAIACGRGSIVSVQAGQLLEQALDDLAGRPRILGEHQGAVAVWWWEGPDRVVSVDGANEMRVWDIRRGRLERTLVCPRTVGTAAFDPRGRAFAIGPRGAMSPRSLFLVDFAGPSCADAVLLLNGEVNWLNSMTFSPDGAWLATGSHPFALTMWNIRTPRALVIGRQRAPFVSVAFVEDGHLVSSSDEGVVRLWSLDSGSGVGVRALWSRPGMKVGAFLSADPVRRTVFVVERQATKVLSIPLDGSAPLVHELKRGPEGSPAPGPASLDPTGRYAAISYVGMGNPAEASLRVLDLSSGAERIFDTHASGDDRCEQVGGVSEGMAAPVWLADGRLVSDGDAGLRLWDLAKGTSVQLRPCRKMAEDGILLLATPDSGTVVRLDPAVVDRPSILSSFDLASRETLEIGSHGQQLSSLALDTSGRVLASGSLDGVVRVGALAGDEPHLLYGHTGPVTSVAISPDGRWIASGSDDGTIRLWPMPDLSKPPLHTWPREELLAKLKSLTNLRAVRDPASDTGWKIEVGPFPGWATVPEWNP